MLSARRDRALFALLGAAMLLVAAFEFYAYWPGFMTWDAVRQYREALRGQYDDWHPPAMDWLWWQLHAIHKGPGPMLALQLGLYWVGFAGLVVWALRSGSHNSPPSGGAREVEHAPGMFEDRPGGRSGLARAEGDGGRGQKSPIESALPSAPSVRHVPDTSPWRGRIGEGWRGLAIALAAAAMLPLPLAMMGAVLKDCQMAGALMAATALLALMPERRSWWVRAPALVLLVGAATLRFNALPACLPLAVALLPEAWRHGWKRLTVATLACALVTGAALPVANRLLRAEPSGVGLSLVIFDLSGITYHSNVDVFPDIDVKNRVAVNARCYTPVKWDHYAFWSPTPCPIQFEAIQDHFADSGESPYVHWAKAILAHPIAYAEHRLAHFNINTRFLVHDEVDAPGQIESAPNPWHYGVAPNGALSFMERAAFLTGHTPLGWPIWWMAVAFAALVLSPGLPSRRLTVPVALSALLYGLGYLPASVAEELRYHLWTMLGACIAGLVVVSDLILTGLPPRGRLMLALAPLVTVTILAMVWRLT